MGDTWDFVNGDGGAEILPSGRFNKWGGNLRNDGRKVRINRDRDGKIVSYSTTDSKVAKIGRSYYVLPTVANGKTVADPVARFNDTGEFWAKAGSEKEARRLANEVHNHHAKRYQKLWNEYIQSNWDDMSPEITEDKTLSDIHAARTYMADLADTGSSDNLPNGPLVSKAYDLMVLTPGVEGFDPVARWDVDGYALGHGAHIWRGEKVKQGQTAGWRDAAEQFRIDIEDRIARMERLVPRFGELPDTHKLAILDIAMGKNGQLTESNSRILFRKLRSATTEKGLRDAVESEYHTYGANVGANVRGRRVTVAKALFGKNLVYELGADGKYKGRYEETQQAAKAGNAGESKSSGVPSGHNAALDGYAGPRVVINPEVFHDDRDALCVAWNEIFRIIMEINGFDPVAEPTEAQRRFFADTAYANDETMLRRTILARICTFDTSIGKPAGGEHTGHKESTAPTQEQLEEAVEFLHTVLEIGAPQNKWEQNVVKRILTVLEKAVEVGRSMPTEEVPTEKKVPAEKKAPVSSPEEVQGDFYGGAVSKEEEDEFKRLDAEADRQIAEEKEVKQFLEERGMEYGPGTTTMEDAIAKHTEMVSGSAPANNPAVAGFGSAEDVAKQRSEMEKWAADRDANLEKKAESELGAKVFAGTATDEEKAQWNNVAQQAAAQPFGGTEQQAPAAAGELGQPKYVRNKAGVMVLNRGDAGQTRQAADFLGSTFDRTTGNWSFSDGTRMTSADKKAMNDIFNRGGRFDSLSIMKGMKDFDWS